MATTPEYGEELMMEEREEELEEASRGPLPREEEVGEAEVVEHEEAEAETHRPAFEDHEARSAARPGSS